METKGSIGSGIGKIDVWPEQQRNHSFKCVEDADADYAHFSGNGKDTEGPAHLLGACLVSWATEKNLVFCKTNSYYAKLKDDIEKLIIIFFVFLFYGHFLH